MGSMVGNLVEQVWKFISAEAEKLVGYKCKLVKTPGHCISKEVSQGPSRLQNLWTLLKATVSAATTYIKESCFTMASSPKKEIADIIEDESKVQRMQYMMEWTLQLYKRFNDQIIQLISNSPSLAKCESLGKTKLEMTVVMPLDSLRPAVENLKVKPAAGGVKKGGVGGGQGGDILLIVAETIQLFVKFRNTATLDVCHLAMGVESFLKIIGFLVGK